MIATIETAVCCMALASWGPGGDSLPLESLSAAEAESYMSGSLFAADSILTAGDSRISIGPSGGPPVSSVLNDWSPGQTYGWQLSWNPSLQELSYEVRESATDVELVSWSMALQNLDSLLFSAQVDDVSLVVDNWVLNGVPLDTDILANATADRIDLLLSDAEVDGIWRLKGDINFDWDGSQPVTGVSSFAIYGVSVPGPSMGLLLLLPMTITGRRRNRS